VEMEKRAQQHIYRLNPQTLSQFEAWVHHMQQKWEERFAALDTVLEREKKKLVKGEQERMNKKVEDTMRKVVLYMTMTCDGFFSGPRGELDWMSQTPDQELNDDIVALLAGFENGFIGYPTASGMIPYWANVAKNPSASKGEREIAQVVNQLHSIILSNKEETLDWENAELLVVKSDNDLVEAVAKVKRQPGGDLGVPGGIRTAQTFVRLGLIDEYVLMVHPVAIGDGKRVFTGRVNLELVSAKTYQSGVVRVCYRPRLRG
jgi:dihydrofolate reductase